MCSAAVMSLTEEHRQQCSRQRITILQNKIYYLEIEKDQLNNKVLRMQKVMNGYIARIADLHLQVYEIGMKQR